MSGGEILVTFAALKQGVADCQSTAANLDGQLSDLEGYLKPLVATWHGEARDLYHAKQQQWNQAQQELNQILQQISRALDSAADDFNAAERSNASLWG